MLPKKIFCLISILIIPTNLIAQDTVFLNTGDKAPYSGYLLSPDKAKEQRNIGLERDSLKLTNLSLQKSLDYQSNVILDVNKQITELKSDKSNLADQLGKQTSSNNLEKIVYFGLGVLATSFAVMAAKQLTK